MGKSFFTVGIGASAGGLPALKEFFDHIETDMNVAFVVLTHLMRDRRSYLDQILSRHIALPVIRVEEDMPLEPGKVYLLIENRELIVKNGQLKVKLRSKEIINQSVDIFLESLAKDFKQKAIAIILSGSGHDGLKGTQAIEQMGGSVIVQDPASAQVDGMPASVILYDHPTVVLNPEAIAERLNYLCRQGSMS